MNILMLFNFLIPIVIGVLFFALKLNHNSLIISYISTTTLTLIISIVLVFASPSLHLFSITNELSIDFKIDGVSKFFTVIFSFVFFLVSIFSIKYMDKEESENKFYGYYLLSLAALIMLSYSANLVTMYLSFETITLVSMPLVMHEKSNESIRAALKYLYYSIGGAFLGLFGLFVFYQTSAISTSFNGVINTYNEFADFGSVNLLSIVTLVTLIGFGAKAGMFPLHGWLPTAHPVAPSPASAVLSGIITKAGIVCIIRIVYFSIGAKQLINTYVQYIWISLILLTILLGSFMAYTQKNLKKRLAYSSVSQLSYILLGIAMLNEDAISGSFLHVASHAAIKVTLFLVAGVIIYFTSFHDVDELDGIGKKLPITMACFTIASLGLIGIPPLGGFVSKWYLAIGSINSGLKFLNYFAPICLLLSAILTAMYLLPISINAFTRNPKDDKKIKEPMLMIIPMIILCLVILAVGLFANPIIEFVKEMFVL